ncbi:Ribonucleoside-diphosphate reductase subunit M2 [Brachionus plicatilis]|uniref:Ribonucleoside-diphosphate reductase subunit M2 n=1 Tax=Brachionus plicatilis TaxID=10195 RepID=A0A3M7PT32_BRAPC|nr:Ribonucleoside-diphosphate reductase subunit M2 [Brachionus plicatilis]
MLSDDTPCSPMKKLKILGEKTQNVKPSLESSNLQSIKENISNNREKEAPESEDTIEHLLEDAPGKYVIFPINHDDMWKMYKHLVDNFWSVTEKIQDLDKLALNYEEKQFMKFFTSIFASPKSSGLVNENFAEEFCKIIQVTEAKFFYGHQLFVQNIHSEMYNKLLLHFMEEQEREKNFKIVENFDAVINKRNWIEKWKTASFGEQLVASSCLHGLMFCSLDLVHNWLAIKTRSILSHELIDIFERMILDQEIQRNFSCLMISHLRHKPSKENMIEMINQAAKLEFDFLMNGIKCDLIGIEANEIIQLIDKKTKELKVMMFSWFYEKNNAITDANENKKPVNEERENNVSKENHHKLVFDEDF